MTSTVAVDADLNDSDSETSSMEYTCGLECCEVVDECWGTCCAEVVYEKLCCECDCLPCGCCEDCCIKTCDVVNCAPCKCGAIDYCYTCNGGICGVLPENRNCCGCTLFVRRFWGSVRYCLYGDFNRKNSKNKCGCDFTKLCGGEKGCWRIILTWICISTIMDLLTDVLLIVKWLTGVNLLFKYFWGVEDDAAWKSPKYQWEGYTLIAVCGISWITSAVLSLFYKGRMHGYNNQPKWPRLKWCLLPLHLVGLGSVAESFRSVLNQDWTLPNSREHINPFRWVEMCVEKGPSALLALWVISRTTLRVHDEVAVEVVYGTEAPTMMPTLVPTLTPTMTPANVPTTAFPTAIPTMAPTSEAAPALWLENIAVLMQIVSLAASMTFMLTVQVAKDWKPPNLTGVNTIGRLKPKQGAKNAGRNLWLRMIMTGLLIVVDVYVRLALVIMWMNFAPFNFTPFVNFLIIFGIVFGVEMCFVALNGQITSCLQFPIGGYISVYQGSLYYFSRRWEDEGHQERTVLIFWLRWMFNCGAYLAVFFWASETNIAAYWNWPVIGGLALQPLLFYIKPDTRTFKETYPAFRRWLAKHQSSMSSLKNTLSLTSIRSNVSTAV